MDVTRLDASRVTVLSNEPVGSLMAGPAIRALNLAEQLDRHGASVTLACPAPPDVTLPVPVRVFGGHSPRNLRAVAADSDVLITQPQRVDIAAALHTSGARIVYDMYVPSFVEYPQSIAGQGFSATMSSLLIQRNQREYATAINCGDAFLTASERQRDYLFGALGQAGRLTASATSTIPRVAVAPFGLGDKPSAGPDSGPTGDSRPLRGTLLPEDSIILLWAGGVYNWFDPATVIEGFRIAVAREPRLRLVFMGTGHASAGFEGQRGAETALGRAHDLVAAGLVVLAADWIPYEQRWNYLKDADAAVCAHRDTLETHFSYRTRLLDHLWAGLPTLCTEGGVLPDEMAATGAALTLAEGDSAAWADAMCSVETRGPAMSAAAAVLAESHHWNITGDAVAAVLTELLANPPQRRQPTPAEVARYLGLAVRTRLGK